MRRYADKKQTELTEVICNRCQKKITVKNGIVQEGVFQGIARFGYFSKKDGMKHQFDLCENCYDKMISEFEIPADVEEMTEYLS